MADTSNSNSKGPSRFLPMNMIPLWCHTLSHWYVAPMVLPQTYRRWNSRVFHFTPSPRRRVWGKIPQRFWMKAIRKSLCHWDDNRLSLLQPDDGYHSWLIFPITRCAAFIESHLARVLGGDRWSGSCFCFFCWMIPDEDAARGRPRQKVHRLFPSIFYSLAVCRCRNLFSHLAPTSSLPGHRLLPYSKIPSNSWFSFSLDAHGFPFIKLFLFFLHSIWFWYSPLEISAIPTNHATPICI